MMNINNTDHFLLAQKEDCARRGASTLELAGLTFAVVAVIALGSLML